MKICLNTRALENNGLTNNQWTIINSFNMDDDLPNKAINGVKELQDKHLPKHKGVYEIYVSDTEDDDLNLVKYFGLVNPSTDFNDVFKKFFDLQQYYQSLDQLEKVSVKWLIEVHGYEPVNAIEESKKVLCYPHLDKREAIFEMIETGIFGDINESFYKYINVDALIKDTITEQSIFDDCILLLNQPLN
jgi:hypothetical protein